MKYITSPLKKSEIDELLRTYGTYIKITIDVEKETLVAGTSLHADGEKVLLGKGSKNDNIWGGGVNFSSKQIDTTAVLNLRPRLKNNSLEILDTNTRAKFLAVVKKIFYYLWH